MSSTNSTKRWRVALAASAMGAAVLPGPAWACGPSTDCVLERGTYRVSEPAGWGGTTPVPAALFFHGWQGSAADVMADASIRQVFSDMGVLLVAVNGLGKTWTFGGSPSQARDDVAFVGSVLDDVERRYPVRTDLVWATGFSQGASMVWTLACQAGARFAGFVAVAGAFWRPLPRECPSGPANLLHIHGLSDGTVPMGGRPIGQSFHQGDVRDGVALWTRTDACRTPAIVEIEGLRCQAWNGCGSGKHVSLCVHDGGHILHPEWFRLGWDFVRTAAGRSDRAQPREAPLRP